MFDVCIDGQSNETRWNDKRRRGGFHSPILLHQISMKKNIRL